MKKIILLFSFYFIVSLAMVGVHAQTPVPVSVKELAPNFGIRPNFLDDTIHLLRYLDTLGGSNPRSPTPASPSTPN